MAKGAAKTGAGPTVVVAMDQFFPQYMQILHDDHAIDMASAGMRVFVSMMKNTKIRDWMISSSERDLPGIWANMLLRKRYIDDRLQKSISSIEAVVNLGAGFDTRAFRLPV